MKKNKLLMSIVAIMTVLPSHSQEITRENWEKIFFYPEKEIKYDCRLGALVDQKITLIERPKEKKDGWLRIVSLYQGGVLNGQTDTKYFKIDEKGYWTKSEGEKPTIIIPFPLKVGDSWGGGKIKVLSISGERETFEETVTDCIIIEETREETGTIKKYYAPGKGLIAIEGKAFSKIRK